jgi:hypothetical protein
VKLGNYERISAAKAKATAVRAEQLRPVLDTVADLSATAAAAKLNARGVTTLAGGRWHAMQVIRARQRIA